MVTKYLKLLIVSLFLILALIQADKSFVLDEIDFPAVSHATSLSGKPIYYRGESSPVHEGIYHPTLYINSLGAFIKAFGYSEISIRIFGVLCAMVSAYLLILILRQLTARNQFAESLLLGLFLLNPYTIANATLPDIDTTILPIIILLFIYTSIKFIHQKKDLSTRSLLILGSIFGLALWTKLTTPLILPLFLLLLVVLLLGFNYKNLMFVIKVALIGLLSFVYTYLIYCLLLDLSPIYSYTFLWDSFTKGTSSDGPVVGAINNLNYIRYFIFWPTIPVVILYGISFMAVIADKSHRDEIKIMKLIAIFALLISIFYIALIPPFGGFFKYIYPVFGLLILNVIFVYDTYIKSVKIHWSLIVLALIAGFVIEKAIWGDDMFVNLKPFNHLLILLSVIVVAFIFMKRYRQRPLTSYVFTLLLFFAIGFQFSLSRVQATAPYPTKYLYGQLGLDHAVDYLESNTDTDEVIWAMKDVGYYVNNRYIESYMYYFDETYQPKLINLLRNGEVQYFVATTGIGQDNLDYYTDIKDILDKHAVKERQFGNFVIYKSQGRIE